MQKLFMIQAFLTRYAELNPKTTDGKMGEEYIFHFDDDALSVRMGDEGYEYSWMTEWGEWYELETVSKLKELLR